MNFISHLSVSIIGLSLLLIAESHYPCPSCPKGQFVILNCSKEGSEWFGTTCGVCRECRGVGQTTIVPCTPYSDAVCGCESGYSFKSTDICQKQLAVTLPPNTPGSTSCTWENRQDKNVPSEIITLLVILPVISLVMVGVLICLHRRSSNQELYKNIPSWGVQNV